MGVISGVVGAFLVYFGSYRKRFFLGSHMLGVTGLIAMAAFLLNVVNTGANFFSKKQEKKAQLLIKDRRSTNI